MTANVNRDRRAPDPFPPGPFRGAHVRCSRELLGLTQTEFGEAIGRGLRTVVRWELDQGPTDGTMGWALSAMLRSRGFHREADYIENLTQPEWWPS